MELNFISFHGLKSRGNNLYILVSSLEAEAKNRGIKVVTSQHDYPVLSIREGRRKWARKIIPEFILKCLALEYRKFPRAKLKVLMHSNATFGGKNALNRYYYEKAGLYDKIKIDEILLFGSVIPRDFNWNRFPDIKVTNFVGSKDIVSRFARFYGMGSSGQKGFRVEAPNLTQYYNKWRHSDFVLPKNFDYIKDIVFE